MADESPEPQTDDEFECRDIATRPSDDYTGSQVGNYTLISAIGHGGMGDIYLARHHQLERQVAIKFLAECLTRDPNYIEMFLREARAASHLQHPGIVAVYDVGALENGVYYLVMEYVEGQDLQRMLQDRDSFSVQEASEYVCQAAEALGYAHHASFVHRDIKPENLILSTAGRIKICDMGLAKRLGEQSAFTQRGMVMGSPNYMAPERLSDALNIDSRVDIYSLGATFFHLLTGRIPYQGTPPVIMAKHLTSELPDAREVNPDLPADLCNIIRGMMGKKPEDRYQTMQEVVDALAPYRA